MPRRVFTAPADLDVLADLEGPLVYLGGPIQGAANWQAEAVTLLGDAAPKLHVASPRAKSFKGGLDTHIAWEQAFIERASRDGVILFWLARATKQRDDRTYAAQARFELGEWIAKASVGLARLVIGIESGFAGRDYLKRRLTMTYPHFPVCRTLKQACAVAAELAQQDAAQVLVPQTLAELFTPQPFGRNNG